MPPEIITCLSVNVITSHSVNIRQFPETVVKMAELRTDDILPNENEDDETQDFIEAMRNENTKRKTASDCNIFKNWLAANAEFRNIDEIPVPELDKLLARFFMKVTKSDGSPYEPGTVKAFQSSISRYLTDKLNISIIKDKEFHHSREVLSAKMKELKSMGLGAKKRKSEPFTVEEINILYEKNQLGLGTHNYIQTYYSF